MHFEQYIGEDQAYGYSSFTNDYYNFNYITVAGKRLMLDEFDFELRGDTVYCTDGCNFSIPRLMLEYIAESEGSQYLEYLHSHKCKVNESVSSEDACAVCMERHKTIALMPCGHVVFCNSCFAVAGKSGALNCPICRAEAVATLNAVPAKCTTCKISYTTPYAAELGAKRGVCSANCVKSVNQRQLYY